MCQGTVVGSPFLHLEVLPGNWLITSLKKKTKITDTERWSDLCKVGEPVRVRARTSSQVM